MFVGGRRKQEQWTFLIPLFSPFFFLPHNMNVIGMSLSLFDTSFSTLSSSLHCLHDFFCPLFCAASFQALLLKTMPHIDSFNTTNLSSILPHVLLIASHQGARLLCIHCHFAPISVDTPSFSRFLSKHASLGVVP